MVFHPLYGSLCPWSSPGHIVHICSQIIDPSFFQKASAPAGIFIKYSSFYRCIIHLILYTCLQQFFCPVMLTQYPVSLNMGQYHLPGTHGKLPGYPIDGRPGSRRQEFYQYSIAVGQCQHLAVFQLSGTDPLTTSVPVLTGSGSVNQFRQCTLFQFLT